MTPTGYTLLQKVLKTAPHKPRKIKGRISPIRPFQKVWVGNKVMAVLGDLLFSAPILLGHQGWGNALLWCAHSRMCYSPAVTSQRA